MKYKRAFGAAILLVAAVMLGGCPEHDPDLGNPVTVPGTVTVTETDGVPSVLVQIPGAVSGTVTTSCGGSAEIIVDERNWHLTLFWGLGGLVDHWLLGLGGWIDIRFDKDQQAEADKRGGFILIPFLWRERPEFVPYVVFTGLPYGEECCVTFTGIVKQGHHNVNATFTECFETPPGPDRWEEWPPIDDPRVGPNGCLELTNQADENGNIPENVWGIVDVFADAGYTIQEILVMFDVAGTGATSGTDGDYVMNVSLDDPDGFSYRGTTPSCAVGTTGTAIIWVRTQYGWHLVGERCWVIAEYEPLSLEEWQGEVDDWRQANGYHPINWADHSKEVGQ